MIRIHILEIFLTFEIEYFFSLDFWTLPWETFFILSCLVYFFSIVPYEATSHIRLQKCQTHWYFSRLCTVAANVPNNLISLMLIFILLSIVEVIRLKNELLLIFFSISLQFYCFLSSERSNLLKDLYNFFIINPIFRLPIFHSHSSTIFLSICLQQIVQGDNINTLNTRTMTFIFKAREWYILWMSTHSTFGV